MTQEDKQQLNSLVTSLEEIINKNIDFIKFSDPNIEKLYTYIKNSLQAIYEKKYLYIVNFQIESLIEYINKNCEGLNKGLKEEENNEKKLINLSKNFDQNFFNDLNFNNKVVKTTPIKKEGESCFYYEQKVKINDIEYQQMHIPGDGNCLLYSIFAHFDNFACRKEEILSVVLYTATEECEENANILRENLLISTLTYTDYVFELFLSEDSVKNQLSEGSRYYYAFENGTGNRVGFFSIYPKEGMMYLSKLYIKKEYRRKGYSGEILEFIKSEAKKEDLHEIFLNVNRNNTGSIEAYRHLGFYVAEETVSDVGEGFICEDYIMKMTI